MQAIRSFILRRLFLFPSVHGVCISSAFVMAPDGKMRAVRFHGQDDLRVEDVDEPKIEPGKIKIKPAWCGICGTDIHEYQEGANLCPTTPHPITGETVPLTFGHEFSGKVEEVGEGCSDKWNVGDRVVVQPIIYDGECGACEDGLINCCAKNGFTGLSGFGGGLAEHIVVPEYQVYHVPDNVGLDVAGEFRLTGISHPGLP